MHRQQLTVTVMLLISHLCHIFTLLLSADQQTLRMCAVDMLCGKAAAVLRYTGKLRSEQGPLLVCQHL